MPTVNLTSFTGATAFCTTFSQASLWNSTWGTYNGGPIGGSGGNVSVGWVGGVNKFFSLDNGTAVDDGVTLPLDALITEVRLIFNYSITMSGVGGSGVRLITDENEEVALDSDTTFSGTIDIEITGPFTRADVFSYSPFWSVQGLATPASGSGTAEITISGFALAVTYTTVDPPTVVDISPDSGASAGQTAVTITGTDFLDGAEVYFDGFPASNVVVVDPTTITCTTPAHPPATASVTVRNPDQQGDTLELAYTFEDSDPPLPIPGGVLAVARREPQVTVRDILNDAPNEATFDTDETVVVGTPLEVPDPVVGTVFKGVAVQTVRTFEGQIDQPILSVTATDRSWYLNRRHPFGKFKETSGTTIVRALIANYAPMFTTNNVAEDLPEISINFNRSLNVGACLTAICQLIPRAKWYLDLDDDIHLFQDAEVDDVPDELNNNPGEKLLLDPPIKIKTDLSQLRTRVYVKGAGNADGSGGEMPLYVVTFPVKWMNMGEDAPLPEQNYGGGTLEDGTHSYYWTAVTDFGETIVQLGELGSPQEFGSGLPKNFAWLNLRHVLSTATSNLDDQNHILANAGIFSDPTIQSVRLYKRFQSYPGDLPKIDVIGLLKQFDRDRLVDDFEDAGQPEGNYIDDSSYTDIDVDTRPPFTQEDIDNQNVWAQVDDEEAQAAIAAIEGGDGIHEHYVEDTSLKTKADAIARGQAELALFKTPIVEIDYYTRDSKSRTGKDVVANLVDPPCVGTFRIQDVTIDEINEGYENGEPIAPRYHVIASSSRFTLEDLLRRIAGNDAPGSAGGNGGSSGGGSGGGSAPPSIAPAARRLEPGATVEFIGDVTSPEQTFVGAGGYDFPLTIANDAVVTAKIADGQVTNAKLADMEGDRIKGRLSTTGAPQDLTGAQVTGLLSTFAQDTKGVVPGPTASDIADDYVLRADGTWVEMTGGGGGGDHRLLDGDVATDTIASVPQVGDIVYAQAAADPDAVLSFMDGGLIPGLPITDETDFFFDGGLVPANFGEGSIAKWGRMPLADLVGGITGAVTKAASVYRVSGLVLADTTLTAVAFSTVEFDDNSFWSAGSPTRFTIAEAGTYRLSAQATWPTFIGLAYARLYKNGVKIAEANMPAGAGGSGGLQVGKTVRAVVGDYFELYLYQASNTASPSTITGGSAETFFQIEKV